MPVDCRWSVGPPRAKNRPSDGRQSSAGKVGRYHSSHDVLRQGRRANSMTRFTAGCLTRLEAYPRWDADFLKGPLPYRLPRKAALSVRKYFSREDLPFLLGKPFGRRKVVKICRLFGLRLPPDEALQFDQLPESPSLPVPSALAPWPRPTRRPPLFPPWPPAPPPAILRVPGIATTVAIRSLVPNSCPLP
jgi:hypothetical protein